MKYQSLREYFYKLYALLFFLVLIPLGAFIYLFMAMRTQDFGGMLSTDEFLSETLIYVFGTVALVDWSASFLIFNRGLKSARTIASLGGKLDRYYSLTIVRFALINSGLLVLAAGFFLIENHVLTSLFMVSLILLGVLWPFPSKVCSDLALRGEERNMVLNLK
jgi:hypothetical protein